MDLTFNAAPDDLRESPALDIIGRLRELGAAVPSALDRVLRRGGPAVNITPTMNVMTTLFRRGSTAGTSIGRMDERFWTVFELQLESARRHQRCFGLSRIELSGEDAAGFVERHVAKIRISDSMTVINGAPVILWSENSRDESDFASARLVANGSGTPPSYRTVTFPADGYTTEALLEPLARRVPSRRDQRTNRHGCEFDVSPPTEPPADSRLANTCPQ